MKEKYFKPKIHFESFALTQTIARDCGYTSGGTSGYPTHYNEDTCVWDAGVVIIFFTNTEESGCDLGPNPDDPDEVFEYEDFCYNGPTPGMELFSSI